MRYDHISINGYPYNTTPNIDDFAQNSILFPNYITQAYLTPVSEASIHTSQYPSTNGFIGFTSKINSQTAKLEDVLKAYGYKNYAFIGSGNFVSDGTFYNEFSPGYLTYRWVPTTQAFPIDPKELGNFTNEKFFLWIALGNAHWPYGSPVVPKDFVNMFVDKNYSGPLKNVTLDENFLPYIRNNSVIINRQLYRLTEDDKKYILANYDSGIRYLDDYLGKIFAKLSQLGLMKNTIVIIQSEHGEELGEHGRYTHVDVFDNTIHTSLIVYSPTLQMHKKISTQVQGIDVMPTILDFLGIQTPYTVQGKSLLPLINENAGKDFDKYIFSERTPYPPILTLLNTSSADSIPLKTYYETLAKFNRTDALSDFTNVSNDTYLEDFSVRTNEWQLIHKPPYKIEQAVTELFFNDTRQVPLYQLYNLKNNPMEIDNLAGKNLPIETELMQILISWEKSLRYESPQYIFNRTVIPNYTFN